MSPSGSLPEATSSFSSPLYFEFGPQAEETPVRLAAPAYAGDLSGREPRTSRAEFENALVLSDRRIREVSSGLDAL